MSPDEAPRPDLDQAIIGEHRYQQLAPGFVGGLIETMPSQPIRGGWLPSPAESAAVSAAIAEEPGLLDQYSWAPGLVLVVSDGSAVMGLGKLGARAVLPVLEAKCAYFKLIAGIDAVPVVFEGEAIEVIVSALTAMRPSYAAISIEDVAAPRCFLLERKLRQALDCPVIHNDQQGTAVSVLAALSNATRLQGTSVSERRIVVLGAGAAGLATSRLLLLAGGTDLVVLDSKGILGKERRDLRGDKAEVASLTNPRNLEGGFADALQGADVLIGLSTGAVDTSLLRLMRPGSVILSLKNPKPEVDRASAENVGALYGSGSADDPDYVTNLLAIPGVLLGALKAAAKEITPSMLMAAVHALIAATADGSQSSRLVPDVRDRSSCVRVALEVALAVASPESLQDSGAVD